MGSLQSFMSLFGFEAVTMLTRSEYFVAAVCDLRIWKEVGWGAIIYLSALSAIDPELYEAATIDGAKPLGANLARLLYPASFQQL